MQWHYPNQINPNKTIQKITLHVLFSDLFEAEMYEKKGVKTRHASGPKLGEYLGAGRDLLNSELPTIRDVLRLGIKYQEDKVYTEKKERNLYPVKGLIRDMAKGVNAMWMKANAEFVPPVIITSKGL